MAFLNKILFVLLLPGLLLPGCRKTVSCLDQPSPEIAAADESSYLEGICRDLTQEWPNNRTITIVCHGHSVPAGYFNTPTVKPFDSYPLLLHRALKKRYPNAVINVIVSAIGGENSIAGAKRFKTDVLNHRPDVVLIDYALNDRSVGLDESARAWSAMIEAALAENIKVLLLTPTPDIHHVPGAISEDLNLHANQIRSLAEEYRIGLVDSLSVFDSELKNGTSLSELLSNGYNHPNRRGHDIVVDQILKWFLIPDSDLKKGKKLNFLFILVDDLGWTDISVLGSRFHETPNIDRLASEGMLFTDAYAACPVCSPTRASILTGKYPARMDTTDWFGAPQPEQVHDHWTRNEKLLPAPYVDELPLGEFAIAEAFLQSGYQTFFAGKWHLGEKGHSPEDQGFDINKGGCQYGNPGKDGYFAPYTNVPGFGDAPTGEHLPERLAMETCQFIEANKNNPFLAYLSFYSVHTPLEAPKDLIEKYETKAKKMGLEPVFGIERNQTVRLQQSNAVYAAMVEAMDSAVGKVLNQLKSIGLDKSTAVIFMSDNGGLSTAEGTPTSNMPLRAGKGWLYEGGIREPLIIKWPGVTSPASKCSVPVISTDFYPTLLEMAGLALLPQQHMDGVSLVPLLKNQKMERGALYWHYPHYGNQGGAPGAVIREGNWKLIKWFEDGSLELFNLKVDLGEHYNLAKNEPQIADELEQKLEKWFKEVDAKMPSPNPHAKDK